LHVSLGYYILHISLDINSSYFFKVKRLLINNHLLINKEARCTSAIQNLLPHWKKGIWYIAFCLHFKLSRDQGSHEGNVSTVFMEKLELNTNLPPDGTTENIVREFVKTACHCMLT
jgi:hypothetical protein